MTRFKLVDRNGIYQILNLYGGRILTGEENVELLNEQQTEIDNLKEENGQLRQFINKGRRLSVKELMDNANENELLKKENRMLKKDLNKLYNLLMDKGMSHNELQDVLWGINYE